MYERYAALFALRNHGGEEAVSAIVDSLSASSALLRHEVCQLSCIMFMNLNVSVFVKILYLESLLYCSRTLNLYKCCLVIDAIFLRWLMSWVSCKVKLL